MLLAREMSCASVLCSLILCYSYQHLALTFYEDFVLGTHLGHNELPSSLDCSNMCQSCDHRWSYLDSHRLDGSHNHTNQEDTLKIRKRQ